MFILTDFDTLVQSNTSVMEGISSPFSADFNEYASAFGFKLRVCLEVWSCLQILGKKVNPEPIQIGGGVIGFALAECKAQRFIELNCPIDIVHEAGNA
jgi:hypothetical protein